MFLGMLLQKLFKLFLLAANLVSIYLNGWFLYHAGRYIFHMIDHNGCWRIPRISFHLCNNPNITQWGIFFVETISICLLFLFNIYFTLTNLKQGKLVTALFGGISLFVMWLAYMYM